MRKLYVAATEACRSAFECEREVIDFDNANFTEVSIAVMTAEEAKAGKLERVESTAFGIPVVILNECGEVDPTLIGRADSIIDCKADDAKLYGRQIDTLALKYEKKVLPPFFGSLEEYVGNGYAQFDCPGHQGGAFFRRHPAGREFAEFFGENIFRSDLCNADVSMGDLLIHEGAPCVAQQEAARIYNADKTYFVLNGTSASNKVVLNALLAPGDLVLFDRNNHKSNHHGALLQAGATPIYLETARNAYGFIGGIDEHCFDEPYLRDMIREVRPEKADAKRPFRLAIIQLGTYDGTIYNARQVVDRIGHLCDYILFDSAWVGYEQFIPMMKDCSPLLLDLGPEDPGIFVTQSVHKQQAGFSQTSQIHKKDSHIKGQSRYCPHKRLNNAFMMHASTLRELNWQAVREEYLPHLLGFAGLIAALLIHSVYTKILVNVRTRQLRETLARQLDLEKEARISRTRLSQMERAGIVSQLSGMLAHEMLQPVTSILNFAGGLRMCVNQRFQEDPAICRASEAISEEAHRIAAIVERVRSYAKDEDSPRICLKASTALEAALKTFQHSSTSEEVRTRVVIKHNPLIEVNKLEIELVLFNLMKNSAAAMADAPSKQLDLSIDQQNNKVIFSIRDFGPQLSEAVFAHLTEPLTSMKKDGLGLGLSLAKAIVERHGGRISFTRLADGLCAEVILPTAATGLEDQTILSTRQE